MIALWKLLCLAIVLCSYVLVVFGINSCPSTCLNCDRGTVCRKPKVETLSSSCLQCSNFSSSCRVRGCNDCIKCPPGTWNNESCAEFCFPCPIGTFQPLAGQTKCLPCGAGTESRKKKSPFCTDCLPGYSKLNTSDSLCSPCAKGTYSDKNKSVTCYSCPIGFYQNDIGQSRCIPCSIGSYCNNTGCSYCVPCGPGLSTPDFGANFCTPCPPGTCKSQDYGSCIVCSEGYYQINPGQIECMKCPAGYFCPCKHCYPKVCPPHDACPEGSVRPYECESPFYKVSNNRCVASQELITVICACSVVVTFVLIVAAVNIYRRRFRKRAHEEHTLLHGDRKHLVYSGL